VWAQGGGARADGTETARAHCASIYWLGWPVNLASIQDAASTSLLCDATSWHRKHAPWNINVLWADALVKWFMGNDQDGRAGIL